MGDEAGARLARSGGGRRISAMQVTGVYCTAGMTSTSNGFTS
jgi:hypothetical protein